MSLEEKDVIANLRALIISCKGTVPISHVQKDYFEAFGVNVPLSVLGYSNLKDLFEKNASDFYLIGDNVAAVEKSTSAHITSLVKRQKNKTKSMGTAKNLQRRPPMRSITKHSSESFVNYNSKPKYETAPRFFKDKLAGNFGVTSRAQETQEFVRQFQKIALRKPHNSNQSNQNSKTHIQSTNHESVASVAIKNALFNNIDEVKPVITKTIKISKNSDSLIHSSNNDETVKYLEPFDNIEDLPLNKSAQTRLLKHKHKLAEDLKSSGENCKAEAKSSTTSKIFFDVNSISMSNPYLSQPNLSSSEQSTIIPEPIPMAVVGPFSKQKAQARLANIKSSVQSKLNPAANDRNESDNLSVKINADNCPNANAIEIPFNNDKSLKDNRLNINFMNSPEDLENSENMLLKNQIANITYNETQSSCDTNSIEIVLSNLKENSIHLEYVRKLSELCISKSLPDPVYRLIIKESKNAPKLYICKIQIGDNLRLSSCPIETQDPDSAQEIAARKMYNYLISNEKYPFTLIETKEKMVSQILEIMYFSYGVWSDKLPDLYRERYKTNLPKDWLDIIMKTSFFDIDYIDGTRFIIRKKTESSITKSSDLNVCQNTSFINYKLAVLKFPESEFWEIYITNINSSSEIWCRLIGEDYSDAYDAMMTKLELEPPESKVLKPKVGEVYGIKLSAIWDRVKLIDIMDDKQGLVFYIDVGDKEIIDLSELYYLEDSFFTVAPQAIALTLFELESFSDDEDLTAVITENLLGNTYIAEIISVSKQIKNLTTNQRIVRLWDTSTELDINVNQLLLNNIIKNITAPVLPNNAQIKEVLVSCVNDNGEIYVQTNQKSIHHLKCIILNKIKSREEKPIISKTTDTIGMEVLYLTKCKSNNVFCRAKIVEIQNSATVDVIFIDHGFTETVAVSELIALEKSSVLQVIPAQAIKVKLANVKNFTSKIAAKLSGLVLNQNVLLKVVEYVSGNVPLIELFKRSQSGNTLYSINMKITKDPELINTDSPSRRKSIVVGLEKVLPKDLIAPDLPNIGEQFEIFVTLASSPDLFIVQPLASRLELMEMMNELQKLGKDPNSLPLPSEEFVVGELYAVKHPDGNWYRGCAQAAVGSYTYSIYLCDFGDCIMVTKEKLMPLPSKFKIFPYQAIRATLFGISPEHKDWTPVDCITFYKLVVEKYFVSTIMEINRDEKNPNYVNLGLILVDTSGDEDIYIHKALMERKNQTFTFVKSINNNN